MRSEPEIQKSVIWNVSKCIMLDGPERDHLQFCWRLDLQDWQAITVKGSLIVLVSAYKINV